MKGKGKRKRKGKYGRAEMAEMMLLCTSLPNYLSRVFEFFFALREFDFYFHLKLEAWKLYFSCVLGIKYPGAL